MVTWQTDRGSLGPSFLYHEHGKICLRLIVRQIVRLRLRLRRVHKAKLSQQSKRCRKPLLHLVELHIGLQCCLTRY